MKSILSKSSEKTEKNAVPAEIPLTFARLLPAMKQVYGCDVRSPNRTDVNLYRRYATIASSCKLDQPSAKQQVGTYKRLILAQQSAFAIDSTLQVSTPFVATSSMDVYMSYVYIMKKGGRLSPSVKDGHLYKRYASLGIAK